MADETPKPPVASNHSTGLGQSSLSSLLSPMNISPSTPSSSFSPSGGLNKFDATIVQMRQQQQGPPGAEGGMATSMKSPPPPPIVSIPLSRE